MVNFIILVSVFVFFSVKKGSQSRARDEAVIVNLKLFSIIIKT